MAVTTNYANTILSALFSGGYIGLSSTEPAADGTNVTEPSSENGYARVAASTGGFTAANKQIKNSNYLYFPLATSNWGTCPYLCVFDGNGATAKLRYYGTLSNAQAIVADTVPLFRPNALEIHFTD
ncbi:MAG: hypothetical protein PHS82_03085 [Lachnospiraceae bacterium]|nr:hypothetical protein [Lachnospiraceae bacterium]